MKLIDQIRAVCTPEQIEKRDDEDIAATVNLTRKKLVSRGIGFGLVLDALGADEGAEVLNSIKALRSAIPKLEYVWFLLEKGELDVGLSSVRTGLDDLVGVTMTQEQADALKALAEVADPVTLTDISDALNGVK